MHDTGIQACCTRLCRCLEIHRERLHVDAIALLAAAGLLPLGAPSIDCWLGGGGGVAFVRRHARIMKVIMVFVGGGDENVCEPGCYATYISMLPIPLCRAGQT